MTEHVFISRSEEETRTLGRKLGENLCEGLCVLLYGDLGAGKTVLVRGVGEALGISGVRSPSFTLINEYEIHPQPLDRGESPHVKGDLGGIVAHADLYRLDDASSLGLEEYEDGVLFVEWPERWKNPPEDNIMKIFITAISESEREVKICAHGAKAEGVLMKLCATF